jgi:hypothetical protein
MEHEKGRIGEARRSGPMGAVPGDRRSLPGPTRCKTFSAAPGSAMRVSENLVWQQRPWAHFSGSPASRRIRRSSRLRSGSPPCGGVWGRSSSCGSGHLRASRRPAWWLWRTSPIRASRGCPPRECAHAASKRLRHILKDRTPAVARLLVLCAARDSRVQRSTRRGATAMRSVSGPTGRGASHFAGRVSVAGVSILLQR